MNIVICASMTFAKEMNIAAKKLETMGHKAIVPLEIQRYLGSERLPDSREEKQELDVIRNYYHKIKENDAILVLNYEKKGIKGYIGANTLIEMAFAYATEKPIFLLNEVPNMYSTDEILAMKAIILNGNLSEIN